MIQWLSVFCAQFAFIGLRAFQQRNVTNDNYYAVVPTSWLMATVEVFVIANIAKSGYGLPLLTAIGLGGSLGCLFAMKLHKRWLPIHAKA